MKKVMWLGGLALVLAACGAKVGNSGQGAGGSTGSSGTTGSGGDGGSGTAGASGTGGQNGTGGTGGQSGTGGSGCGFCDFTCCGATCVNTDNDIKNCGACGNECTGTNPYCDKGKCGTPPCNGPTCGPGGLCCGSNCCMPGELCCDVPGPIGNMLGCFAPNANGTCPTGCALCQCNSPDTPIATPEGERPIASLQEGELVYSVHQGAIMAVPIRKVQRVPVEGHVVVHVELAGGRVLEISPRHPTADGRSFGDLKAGGALDGLPIVDARLVSYPHKHTYDILPDSDTGTYFAAGARIGSTMTTPPPPFVVRSAQP